MMRFFYACTECGFPAFFSAFFSLRFTTIIAMGIRKYIILAVQKAIVPVKSPAIKAPERKITEVTILL